METELWKSKAAWPAIIAAIAHWGIPVASLAWRRWGMMWFQNVQVNWLDFRNLKLWSVNSTNRQLHAIDHFILLQCARWFHHVVWSKIYTGHIEYAPLSCHGRGPKACNCYAIASATPSRFKNKHRSTYPIAVFSQLNAAKPLSETA